MVRRRQRLIVDVQNISEVVVPSAANICHPLILSGRNQWTSLFRRYLLHLLHAPLEDHVPRAEVCSTPLRLRFFGSRDRAAGHRNTVTEVETLEVCGPV